MTWAERANLVIQILCDADHRTSSFRANRIAEWLTVEALEDFAWLAEMEG